MRDDPPNDEFAGAPETAMAYIADMLGAAFRDKMIATMGGTAVKVPSKASTLTDDHSLVRNLGRDDAEELVSIMAGEALYIPNGVLHTGRRSDVASLVLAGKTNGEIARELGISERQVRRHRANVGLGGHTLRKLLDTSCTDLSRAIRGAASRLMVAERF